MVLMKQNVSLRQQELLKKKKWNIDMQPRQCNNFNGVKQETGKKKSEAEKHFLSLVLFNVDDVIFA
jgi:hypothetical protein